MTKPEDDSSGFEYTQLARMFTGAAWIMEVGQNKEKGRLR
jgi:hypothetical protein